MVKCSRCKKPAFTKLARHNASFCEECFELFFSRQVNEAIKKYRMFHKTEPVLLGVSGGKDSMSLWHYLHRSGYQVVGIHFDLGIGEYSYLSRKIAEDFAQSYALPLQIIALSETIGYSIPQIAQRIRHRSPCSLCGSIKRYLLNQFAFSNHFTVYATGHNLDDETATLLGNVLHWQTDYLAHQNPSLPSPHPKMPRKVKPFYSLTEEEISLYARIKEIPFITEPCPLSKKAKSLNYKEALNLLEKYSPGTKHNFFFGFLEKASQLFSSHGEVVLKGCEICGMPTTQKTCSFCKIMQKVHERKDDHVHSRTE